MEMSVRRSSTSGNEITDMRAIDAFHTVLRHNVRDEGGRIRTKRVRLPLRSQLCAGFFCCSAFEQGGREEKVHRWLVCSTLFVWDFQIPGDL